MKFRWLNYFLVLILFNVSLHVFYLYLLLGAHDSLDGTASSLYSFEQALVLCKKEMIYRDLGLATREALALALEGNQSSQQVLPPPDPEVGRHPAQWTKLGLRLEPSEGTPSCLSMLARLNSCLCLQESMISGGCTKYTTSW